MKNNVLKSTFLLAISLFTIATTTASCSKDSATTKPGTGTGTNPGTGPHIVDARLVGTWMWTSAGDANWYDQNGTYTGPSYGLAQEYKVNADGSGTALSHFVSTIGAGSSMEVNIASTGFFESDNAAHFGYFPLSGTYESTGAAGGEDRNLNTDELYNPATGKGKFYLFQKLEFKTISGRQCFEVTSTDNTTDRYYKIE